MVEKLTSEQSSSVTVDSPATTNAAVCNGDKHNHQIEFLDASNQPQQIVRQLPEPPARPDNDVAEKFYWDDVKGRHIIEVIDECYDMIVYWRKNIFMLPNGATGKEYIGEVTRLLNAWVDNSPIGIVSMKAIHIMPALLLQKHRRVPKVKSTWRS